jgi:predicted SprT family Zn-dependent metalloprotease
MFGIEKDFQKLMEQVYGPLKRNKMTNMTERAKKIMRAYEAEDTYNYPQDGVAAALRQTINELQQSPGVIMCADVLELCEEIEKL